MRLLTRVVLWAFCAVLVAAPVLGQRITGVTGPGGSLSNPVTPAQGGTGVDSSGSTGIAYVAAGVWSFIPCSSGLLLGGSPPTCPATITSSQLIALVSDETGTGLAVFNNGPTFIAPVLGAATGTSFQGIIGNITPAAITGTTITTTLPGPHRFGGAASAGTNAHAVFLQGAFAPAAWDTTVETFTNGSISNLSVFGALTLPAYTAGTPVANGLYVRATYTTPASGAFDINGSYFDSPPVTLNGTATIGTFATVTAEMVDAYCAAVAPTVGCFAFNAPAGLSRFADGVQLGSTSTFKSEAANIVGLRNSANAMEWRLYNSYTSATSYEALRLSWKVTGNVARLETVAGSGGGTTRQFSIGAGGTNTWDFQTNGSVNVSSGNAFDIATAAAPLRTVFVQTSLVLGVTGTSVTLVPDAANVVAVKSGTTAQALRVYGTTAGTKYLQIDHDGTNGDITSSSGAILLNPATAVRFNGTADFAAGNQVVWGAAFGTNDVGLARSAAATLKVTDSSSGFGALTAGGITSAGHIQSSTTAPAVSNTTANSCGTTAATIVGTDVAGKVTVGATAGTSCTITFTTTWTNAPACTVTNETTANLLRATSTTTTVILAGTMVAGDVLAYMCIGRV